MSPYTFVTEALDAVGFHAAAARRRWKRINAERPRTCLCGKPGTVLRTAEGMPGTLYSTYGGPEWWYCEQHRAVPLDTPWCNGKPMVKRFGVWESAP